MNIAIIFAGGVGQRLNQGCSNLPKQFLNIYNKPIIIHTLEKFDNHDDIDKIYISTLKKYKDYTKELIERYNIKKVAAIVDGGNCAMQSIYNALIIAQQENDENSIVLIHDGVRPIITKKVITDNIKTTIEKGNAITVIPTNETIIISKDNKNVDDVTIRKQTYKAQAPQSFYLGEIIKAHKSINSYDNIVDNCTLYNILGKKTHLVEGNFGNIKITTPRDIYILKGIMEFIEKREQLD